MTGVNPEIEKYIVGEIYPKYQAFDPAHRIDHVRYVVETALSLSRYYDVNRDMVAMAAACHDLGLCRDRKTHHLVSGRIIRENRDLERWFTAEQIETIAQAAEDHRASSDHEPRGIYSALVAEADRQIIPGKVILRTIQYGLDHYPELDREGHWTRMLEHLQEKYAEGGYLKLWISESPNAERLRELRSIIRDRVRLRSLFDDIFDREIVGKEQGDCQEQGDCLNI